MRLRTGSGAGRRLFAWINAAAVVAVFFGILAGPLLWFGRPDFAPVQAQASRGSTPPPGLSIDWPQRFERWFNDGFGFRDALIYYGSRLQMARTGTPFNQKVVIGRDQWLFFDDTATRGRPHFVELRGQAPLAQSQLARIVGNLVRIHRNLQACGIRFYFVMPPDKQTLYRDKLGQVLPENVTTPADQLFERIRAADPALEAIDLRPVLKQARALLADDLYMRTDTHWNELGAFEGYQAIARRLVADHVLDNDPRAQLPAYKITRTPFPGGDIAVNLLSLSDYFEDQRITLEPLVPRTGRIDNARSAAPSASSPAVVAYENTGARGRMVIFHDSFGNYLLPFLAEDFSRLVAVSGRLDGALVKAEAPGVVVLEAVERNLATLVDPPLAIDSPCN